MLWIMIIRQLDLSRGLACWSRGIHRVILIPFTIMTLFPIPSSLIIFTMPHYITRDEYSQDQDSRKEATDAELVWLPKRTDQRVD